METNNTFANTVRRFDCAGGCGRFQMVRPKKVLKADFYVCNWGCADRLPARIPGQFSVQELNACGGFYGITYKWPDAEEIASGQRATAIKIAAEAKLALLKAQQA